MMPMHDRPDTSGLRLHTLPQHNLDHTCLVTVLFFTMAVLMKMAASSPS